MSHSLFTILSDSAIKIISQTSCTSSLCAYHYHGYCVVTIVTMLLPIVTMSLPIVTMSLPIVTMSLAIVTMSLPFATMSFPIVTMLLPIVTMSLPIVTMSLCSYCYHGCNGYITHFSRGLCVPVSPSSGPLSSPPDRPLIFLSSSAVREWRLLGVPPALWTRNRTTSVLVCVFVM